MMTSSHSKRARLALAVQAVGGVSRIVLTSSMAVISAGHDPVAQLKEPEKQWTNPENADNYSKSKTMAEGAAWATL